MNYGFRKSDWLGDWYVIDHCGGQPEGPAEHWRLIIAAMRAGERHSERRVGCSKDSFGYKIYSPRNACGEDDFVRVPQSEVGAFCLEAEAELARCDDRVDAGAGI